MKKSLAVLSMLDLLAASAQAAELPATSTSAATPAPVTPAGSDSKEAPVPPRGYCC